jgi:hypothetical protein
VRKDHADCLISIAAPDPRSGKYIGQTVEVHESAADYQIFHDRLIARLLEISVPFGGDRSNRCWALIRKGNLFDSPWLCQNKSLMSRTVIAGVFGSILLCLMAMACAPWQRTGAIEAPEHHPRKIIQVGKEHPVKTIAAAAQLAHDGDVIEISAGDYTGDTAVWTQNNLRIRGINGRPRLIAAGKAAEGKAIWVIRGNDIVVENIEFTGARVPVRNGAGIRFERGKLTVRKCLFTDNENGILVGNDRFTILEIQDSEFGNNGAGDGQSHNLYIGAIGHFTVQGTYFHHARVGHLLKTRARENFVYYNRLTDERDGRASYELEFPVGGMALVVGNLITQSGTTENPTIISFGSEGYQWPQNDLHVAHNTIVNNRAEGGVFIRVRPGSVYVRIVNNILVGKGEFAIKTRADINRNWRVDPSEFVAPSQYDYRLKADSPIAGTAGDPGEVGGTSLRPTRYYTYPFGTLPLPSIKGLNPGALQGVTK